MAGSEVIYKTPDEIELIRESASIVGMALTLCAQELKPGISGLQLDKMAEELIRDQGGVPGFKGYGGFPNSLCISINSQVVHGIPSDYVFQEGDIVSIDCGVKKSDFFGDHAYTFAIGEIKASTMKLLRVTKTSLYRGIDEFVYGNRLGDISHAIQKYAEGHGFSVVRELVGHGLGRSLHEGPELPNYGKRGRGMKLQPGLVLAIEPMINEGKKAVRLDADGWTVRTKDGMPSAHYEHDVTLTENGFDILSSHVNVESAESKNPNLSAVELMKEELLT